MLSREDRLAEIYFFAALVAALLVPFTSTAEPVVCKSSSLTVDAADDALVETICTVAERATTMLSACYLQLPQDIQVVVYDDLPGVSSRCVGTYECAENRISLRSPKHLDAARDPSSAFSAVEKSVFFTSVLIHELAHAAFENTAREAARCANNHEYVAYVMQMLSLPAHVRQVIVDSYRAPSPVDPYLLNSLIAGMAPDRFAAIAWQHFTEEGHGCNYVRDLITGRETLQLFPE